MSKCFVIQPFDQAQFDKRYDDILVPAIKNASLEPYRVDRDPKVSIPIDEIQSGIQSSEICLAEISTDNPNVWFELGYAIAVGREVVLICSNERKVFPFDVQHRKIIRYTTESPSDFKRLQEQITARLVAIPKNKLQLEKIAQVSTVSRVEGLEQYEVAALVSIAQDLNEVSGGLSIYLIRQSMEAAGFTKIATTLGLRALMSKQMLEEFEDQNFNGETFLAYRVTEKGMNWLLENTSELSLTKTPEYDEIPF